MTVLLLFVLAASSPDAGPDPAPFLRLRAVGDVMLGTTVPEGHLPPDDGATLLAAVSPLLQDADLTFANLEGPLCGSGISTKCKKSGNCFAFRTPTTYGKYLQAAGLDRQQPCGRLWRGLPPRDREDARRARSDLVRPGGHGWHPRIPGQENRPGRLSNLGGDQRRQQPPCREGAGESAHQFRDAASDVPPCVAQQIERIFDPTGALKGC